MAKTIKNFLDELSSSYFIRIFLIYQIATRITISLYALFYSQINFFEIFPSLLSGLINDLVAALLGLTFLYFIRIPFLPLLYWRKLRIILEITAFLILNLILTLNFIGEIFFWDEFGTRYNFIAVDYIVYTHEVLHTIIESIPVIPVLIGVAIYLILLTYYFWNYIIGYSKRSIFNIYLFPFLCFTSLIVFKTYSPERFILLNNNYSKEISKNGIYELFYAYFNNELDYNRFYPQIDKKTALKIVRDEIKQAGDEFLTENGIKRKITPNKSSHKNSNILFTPHQLFFSTSKAKAPEKPKKPNFVVILVESLSASFMTEFGQKENLTPYLDKLAKSSLFLTNAYATGTRTVRGLEAIVKSIPPTPGTSILRRPNNENIFTISSVLKPLGYTMDFVYGGYSYFDNMKYFFKNNGFEITDRGNFNNDEITFANVWGIADTDVNKKLISLLDERDSSNNPFFALYLTTSNHRPYTFPEGHIDMPQGSRESAVRYTDEAIKELIETAKTKDWFDNTIFVVVADHCASSAGKTDLPAERYHIPILIYGPKLIEPRKIDSIVSQIDLMPTLLGLTEIEYESEFFGMDVLKSPANRAFISTYQLLGYIDNNAMAILSPGKDPEIKLWDDNAKKSINYNNIDEMIDNKKDPELEQKLDLISKAISFFQTGFNFFKDEQQ